MRRRLRLLAAFAIPPVLCALAWILEALFQPYPGPPIIASNIAFHYAIFARLNLELTAILCLLPMIILLVVGVFEKPGRWGLADRTFRAYRSLASGEGNSNARPVDWHRVSEDYRYSIAMIATLSAVACIAFAASWSSISTWVRQDDEGPILTAVIYVSFVISWVSEMMALLAIAALCALLPRRIRLRPARWLVVAPGWVLVGLGLMSAAALGSGFLQATLNSSAFRRITPDD